MEMRRCKGRVVEGWKAGEAFHWRDEGVRAFEGSSPQAHASVRFEFHLSLG